MGLYDRDYAREASPGGRGGGGGVGGGGGRRPPLGALRLVSVNTWLIVVNIAVFILANVLLAGPRFITPVSMGPEGFVGVSQQTLDAALVDRSRVVTIPGLPPGYPMYDAGTRGLVGVERVQMMPVLQAWGHFSTYKAFMALEVWRFVTFQFLHADVTHLVFNLLGLWFVGGLVEEYLGRKRYAAFYLVCGVFGALMYLVLNFLGWVLEPVVGQTIPGLLFDNIRTPLVGASAGIFGVLMAAAYIAPRAEILVMFAIPMRLRTAVYLFAAIALFNLFRDTANAGGEAAHVGGAVAGYFFIRRMHLLRDFFDVFGDSRAGAGGGRGGRGASAAPGPDQREVDRLLGKVAAEGMKSLTEAEKQVLRSATEASRRG